MIETLISLQRLGGQTHLEVTARGHAHYWFVTLLIYFWQSFNKKVEDVKLHSERFRKNLMWEVKWTVKFPGGGAHQYTASLGDSNNCGSWDADPGPHGASHS